MPVALLTRPLLDRAPPWVLRGGGVPADLDFDFINRRFWQQGRSSAIDQLLTTSRASTGYADYNNGTWVSFANNIPRITNKGLLVEESRTNSIRNNSMQGAVVGSSSPTTWSSLASLSTNGLTANIAAVGVQNVIEYIDLSLSGTASATTTQILQFETSTTQIAASNNQTWELSAFLALVSGALPGAITFILNQRNGSGSNLGDAPSVDISSSISSSLARSVGAITTNNASTAFIIPRLGFAITSGQAVNFTVRIGWPQLELGSFATSPIRTTNAAATRAADIITVFGVPAFNKSYSLFVQAVPTAPLNYSNNQSMLFVSDGTTNNRIGLRRIASTGLVQQVVSSGGVDTLTSSGSAWAQSASGKLAASFAPNDQAFSFNGGVAVTGSVALPSTFTRIGLDRGDGSNPPNGYIGRIAVWTNMRVSNPELRRITS